MKKMKLEVKLSTGAKMPTKAHDWDAGFDLYSREGDMLIRGGSSATFDTGVHIAIPKGYCGFLKSKSGLNVKHDLTSDGVIDAGYTGSIVVKLYNNGDTNYVVKNGDKITQLVILPVPKCELVEVDELGGTERGDRGFGSSGR